MYSFQGASIEKSSLQCEFSVTWMFFGICSSVISTAEETVRQSYTNVPILCSVPHLQMSKVLDSDIYV